MAQPNPRASLIHPKSLMAIRNLEFRARIVVQGFWNGLHRSPYHGFSVEFTEFRQYSPGDDLRYLDWRVFARSDRHYIKKFEDETNLRCHLLVDHSKSMGYGSLGYTKSEYANTLAATIAYFLFKRGDSNGRYVHGLRGAVVIVILLVFDLVAEAPRDVRSYEPVHQVGGEQ